MPDITIQLPTEEADQSIEIEVRVNGRKKKYHYLGIALMLSKEFTKWVLITNIIAWPIA